MILEAIKFSNHFFLENFFRISYVCAIPILFLSVVPLFIDLTFLNNKGIGVAFFQFIYLLLQLLLTSVTMLLINDLNYNRSQAIANYFFKSLFFVPTLLLTYIFVGVAMLLGFLLLILPGIYLLGRFLFVPYVVVLEKKKFYEALNTAQGYGSKNAWILGSTVFLIYSLFIFLFFALGIFPVEPTKTSSSPLSLFFVYLLSFVFQIYLNIFIYSLLLNEREIEKE